MCVGQWLNRNNQLDELAQAGKEHGRNKAYQRYFEDHVDYYLPKENGKGVKIIHVFVGQYHYAKDGQAAFVRRKAIYFALWAAAAVLFLYAAVSPVEGANENIVCLLQFFTLLTMGWSLVELIGLLLARFHMTTYMFKSFQYLKPAALMASAVLVTTALSILLIHLLRQVPPGPELYRALAGYLCAGGAMALLGWIESGVCYGVFLSQEQPPPGAEKIVTKF